MVSKITILEPHFDGAQFGPASMELQASEDDIEDAKRFGLGGGSAGSTESSEGSNESKSKLVTLLQGVAVFVVMFAVLWTVLSRLGDDEESAS